MPDKWNDNVVIPNPVSDGVVSVYMKLDRSQQVTFRLVDLTGRLLQQQTKQISTGMTQYTANVGALQKGVYLMQVIGEDFRTSKKISIE